MGATRLRPSATSACLATFIAAALVAAVAGPLASAAPEVEQRVVMRSAELAPALATLMEKRALTAFAARDPETEDRYIAAMVFPGVQILLMSARSEARAYMEARLEAGEYADVYNALQQGVPDSKVFFQDMGADGFQAIKGSVPDVMYERGSNRTLLDGDWKASGLTEAVHLKMLKDADQRYSHCLSILINALTPAQP